MRTNLQPLLGKTVLISGYKNETIKLRDGVSHCIKHPSIIPYKETRRIKIDEYQTKTDHLWAKLPKDSPFATTELERYERCIYTGVIEYYKRKDGSDDIGCVVQPHINMDEMLSFCNQAEEYTNNLDIFVIEHRLKTLEDAKKNGHPFITYTHNIAPKDAYFKVKQKLLAMKATIESGQVPIRGTLFI